jgi:hypothetical protein
MAKHFSTTDEPGPVSTPIASAEPPELNADDVLSSFATAINYVENPGESPAKPAVWPARGPGGIPAERPMGVPVGITTGDAVGLPLGAAAGQAQGFNQASVTDSHLDWSLWWGTFQTIAGARVQVWRCSAHGLNIGDALLVMTVDDARRLRLDDYATARNYFAQRFGAGRYRLTPRSDQGGKLPGTQSLTVIIEEDTAMQVNMTPASALNATVPVVTGLSSTDKETAIQIERMRLQSDSEREREIRRERQRELREERRREKEAERERRREDERKRRDEEDRRRTERELHMHTLMVQMLKEVAGGRANTTNNDALIAAILSKVGQPDPLVLKLLDTHGKREELTDFFKVQAESMRMASTLQTDSLKQVMVASQEVQSQLMRQAAEVATQRDGGDGWSGIGSVLSATAHIVSALRGGENNAPLIPSPALPIAEKPAVINPPLAQGKIIAAPVISSTPQPTDSVGDILRHVRTVHRSGQGENIATLKQIITQLPPTLRDAIRAGDVSVIHNHVMPAVQKDPSLAEWLSQPDVGDWLTSYLQRLRQALGNEQEGVAIATSTMRRNARSVEDEII